MQTLMVTKRLFLRNLENDDSIDIYDYRNNVNCYRFQKWDDTSLEYIKKFVREFSNCHFLSLEENQHYAICLKDNKIIGDVSIFYNASDNCFTIGYTISYKYQRNGYAYELLSELIKQLIKHYPSIEIVALVLKENSISISLLKKLGFIEECYASKINSYIYVINRR